MNSVLNTRTVDQFRLIQIKIKSEYKEIIGFKFMTFGAALKYGQYGH